LPFEQGKGVKEKSPSLLAGWGKEKGRVRIKKGKDLFSKLKVRPDF